ncbi:MAG: 16S rRNA (guanine(966)-N(2))-methyltransferase RsmD [Peptococcaceae bacterium]|nr:16S rRNA (guanine(966)-N(2))-methyltransferase RsmD [Peptococcaceae bacterium]
MRIIAGCAKKMKLKVPSGWDGRPTSDRVKEALFNILGNIVPESKVLDLFAGTGNIGIEALSRGAKRVCFIEKDPRAVKVITENLRNSKLVDKADVHVGDVARVLPGLSGRKFDFIFLDPPYDKEFEVSVISMIFELELLSIDGIIVAESSKRVCLPLEIMGFRLADQRRYGDTLLSFFTSIQG